MSEQVLRRIRKDINEVISKASKRPPRPSVRVWAGEVAANPLSNVGYILDLVKSLGKWIGYKSEVVGVCPCDMCKEKRASLPGEPKQGEK